MCYITFEGQFRCWLDLSILILAQKCFSDNSCPVVNINASILLVKSLHEKQQRKERLWGTDLGIRTLTKELEVPSKPNLSPIPWLPLPMHCSTRPHPQGGRAQTPARKPKGGRALTFGKELERTAEHTEVTQNQYYNSRITKRTETTAASEVPKLQVTRRLFALFLTSSLDIHFWPWSVTTLY